MFKCFVNHFVYLDSLYIKVTLYIKVKLYIKVTLYMKLLICQFRYTVVGILVVFVSLF